MKIVSPSPLMGEGGGEGESKPLPLTSILSPGGERRYIRGYFLHNSIVIGPGLGLGPEKGIRDETKKTVHFIFSPASPSNHLLEAFYQNMPEYPLALLGG